MYRLWYVASDIIPPQKATILAEDLSIKFNMEEHLSLKHGSLCKNLGQRGSKFKVLKFIFRTTKINSNIKEAKEQRFTV